MKMKTYFLSLLVLFLFIVSIPLYSAEKMRIAVLDLKADGIAAKNAKIVTNLLRTDMINIGKFTVIERSQMNSIMGELKIQQSGCTDQECAVQIGQMLSARKILIGEVSSIDDVMIILTVRIVDVEQGVSNYAAREKCPSMNEIDTAITKISRKLAHRIESGESIAESSASSNTGYFVRGFILPGWGQFYAGKTVKGYIFLGSFLLAGAFTGYTLKNYIDKNSDYEDDKTHDNWEKVDKAAKNYSIAIGIFAAVYVVNIIDILFLSKPVDTQISSNAGQIKLKDTYLSFNMYRPYKLVNEKYYNITLSKRF